MNALGWLKPLPFVQWWDEEEKNDDADDDDDEDGEWRSTLANVP